MGEGSGRKLDDGPEGDAPPPPPPAQHGSAAGCCCHAIPWFQTLCTGIILAALVVFFVKTGQAFGAVNTLMTELKLGGPVKGTVKTVLSALLGGGVGVVFFTVLLAIIATVASAMGKARRYRMRRGAKIHSTTGAACEIGTDVLVVLFMWLCLALIVALIAMWTAFFLGSFSGDHGASYAMGTTDKLQEKIASALKKADGLFVKMRGAWTRLVNKVPTILKNNSWFQELTTDIGGPLLSGANALDDVSCPPNCLDLGVFATMMSFEPRCVCGKEMLTDIQKRLRTSWTSTAAALGALAAIAVAGSFVLMATIGSFVNSKRDLKDIKWRLKTEGAAPPPPPPPPAKAPSLPPPARAGSGAGPSDVETGAPDQQLEMATR
ncbi:hypothetical protein Rsub_01584 [Raphidocelis subcapitata]|uniref:Uncharacterized protein n=1 Tax=Raphidocelis subcapitata TaxID=307507 RepID=A0A2V0NV32_9CHLO|nr:hypothetical protein Rsub_01584 [Raphidocelis subcapitata]|eukprot:GBF88685.1 hypothetical protein Rsub_01584 [Raphidocelis subcapitata]